MILVMLDSPSLLFAFAAGLISFVSPCCLPLVPGYLAAVSRTDGTQLTRRVDPVVVGRSLIFVASFSLVFILLGLGSTLIGAFLFDNQPTLNKVAGAAIIVMGLLFVASQFLTGLNWEWRPRGLIERAGAGGPAVAGVAFAVAWTPCVGPTLGAILGLAATRQGTAEGAGLLAVYAAGLAVPFLFSAMAFSAATRSFALFKRHYRAIQLISGAVLIAMGMLVMTGELFRLNIEVQQFLDRFGLNFFQSL